MISARPDRDSDTGLWAEARYGNGRRIDNDIDAYRKEHFSSWICKTHPLRNALVLVGS